MPRNIFTKSNIPEKIPKEIEDIIKKLKKSKDKQDCLKKAYYILLKKYRGYRYRTYTRLYEIFIYDINKIWQRKGFLHCTLLNYLLQILLIKSGFFKHSDIKIKWTFVWYFSPHQYLQVRLNKNQWINVDIWGNAYGIKLGDYSHGFH